MKHEGEYKTTQKAPQFSRKELPERGSTGAIPTLLASLCPTEITHMRVQGLKGSPMAQNSICFNRLIRMTKIRIWNQMKSQNTSCMETPKRDACSCKLSLYLAFACYQSYKKERRNKNKKKMLLRGKTITMMTKPKNKVEEEHLKEDQEKKGQTSLITMKSHPNYIEVLLLQQLFLTLLLSFLLLWLWLMLLLQPYLLLLIISYLVVVNKC